MTPSLAVGKYHSWRPSNGLDQRRQQYREIVAIAFARCAELHALSECVVGILELLKTPPVAGERPVIHHIIIDRAYLVYPLGTGPISDQPESLVSHQIISPINLLIDLAYYGTQTSHCFVACRWPPGRIGDREGDCVSGSVIGDIGMANGTLSMQTKDIGYLSAIVRVDQS
ncbi:MAG: hypothetical protein A4E45_00222 [Methanosaeta sp. PtaB.Bin039]|nr:MAG: hypothetical protein A4E45_00222 [Methanosaeta sp. PtaB.Bin039]